MQGDREIDGTTSVSLLPLPKQLKHFEETTCEAGKVGKTALLVI